MVNFVISRLVVISAIASLFSLPAFAQNEGIVNTQALVEVSGKGEAIPAMADVQMSVEGKKEQLTGWSRVSPNGVQIAILMDDGLRMSVGRELSDFRAFVNGLPPGVQVYIGYMRNGTVETAQSFTTDHGAAASRFRLPLGSPGISASPYFCVSEFVKHWPTDPAQPGARFIMMITNGVDPYNGSTSILNQDSPYVQAAIEDAQRAGVSVSSVYYGDSGFRGGRGSFSGQSYLAQTSDGTGGRAYYEGTGNPVSLSPYLAQFQHAISETFVATFPAKAKGKELVRIKAETKVSGTKLRTPTEVLPGNAEMAVAP